MNNNPTLLRDAAAPLLLLGGLVAAAALTADAWLSTGIAALAGPVLGGWLGARTAISRGNAFVRLVFLVVVGGLVLRLGYDIVTG